MAILSLIQLGLLSVIGKSISTWWLGSLPRNSGDRLTDGSPCVPGYLKTHIIIINMTSLVFMLYFQLDADRDMEEMFYDISKLLDFAFFADDSGEKVSIRQPGHSKIYKLTCMPNEEPGSLAQSVI